MIYILTDRKEIKDLLDEEEDGIRKAIKEGSLMTYMAECPSKLNQRKRKSRKTEKMMSYIDEERTASSPTKKASPAKKKAATTETNCNTAKKKKKVAEQSDVDSPSKSTRSKARTDPVAETQRLQSLQYFERKKAKVTNKFGDLCPSPRQQIFTLIYVKGQGHGMVPIERACIKQGSCMPIRR